MGEGERGPRGIKSQVPGSMSDLGKAKETNQSHSSQGKERAQKPEKRTGTQNMGDGDGRKKERERL